MAAAVAQSRCGLFRGLSVFLGRNSGQLSCLVVPTCKISTSHTLSADFDPEKREKSKPIDGMEKEFLKYNEIKYPPTKEGEEDRAAEICHIKTDVQHPYSKMWYPSIMIRGLTIDEAVKQLSFSKKKAHHIVKEVLLEAQDLAVKEFNVEYKSNLWVADSFSKHSYTVYNMRFHARRRMGKIHQRNSTYFVRLREGQPPKHYYPPPPTGNELLEEYITEQRSRRILNAL